MSLTDCVHQTAVSLTRSGLSLESYKYLAVQFNDKLVCPTNTEVVDKMGLSRFYFLRRLRSFNNCNKIRHMFYQSLVASTIFFTAVCWSAASEQRTLTGWTNSKKAVCHWHEAGWLEEEVEGGMLAKRLTIMDNDSHSPQKILDKSKSTYSSRLIPPRCLKERGGINLEVILMQ